MKLVDASSPTVRRAAPETKAEGAELVTCRVSSGSRIDKLHERQGDPGAWAPAKTHGARPRRTPHASVFASTAADMLQGPARPPRGF